MNKELTRWERRRMEHTQRRESLGLEDSDGEPLSDAGPPISGEQNLWVAVILQAFMDASWRDFSPTYQDDKRSGKFRSLRHLEIKKAFAQKQKSAAYEAIAWLRGTTRDFYDICFLAGQEPGAVCDAARAAEAKGWPPIAAW